MLGIICHRLKELPWTGHVSMQFYNEPLMNPNLDHITAEIEKACPGCLPGFDTDGDYLTMGRCESLLRAGIKHIRVSRHKPYKEEWDDRINLIVARFPHAVRVVPRDNHAWLNRGGLVKQLPGPNSMKGAKTCHRPTFATINIDGKMLLCCCDFKSAHVMGDITQHSIRDIWNSYEYTPLRSRIRRGIFDTDMCRKCTETTPMSSKPNTLGSGTGRGTMENIPAKIPTEKGASS
jgi:radical SAM protein with 4Fe4S-binding SPASM domain